MKIINKNWQRKIEIEENTIYTLVFENKKYYRENIKELIRQHKGNEGNFIYSNDNKEISFEKNSYIITDIFNIEINSKKILTKIYNSLLKQIIDDTVEYNEITTHIRAYFEKLIFNSLFEVEQGEEIDINSFLKLGDFRIHIEEDDILEKFIKFLKALVQLCGINIIFIVGLHNVFTDEETKEIYKEVCINKISIINIEYQQFDNLSDENYIEKVYIFDKDNCEI
ncbi:MAG: type II-A CRISPR-associated protein Csn2 [Gemella haemolysans]|uniref:type II-A CRISPR-associated protein Csn2 n=1 Tax=Gemella haemolysans TaxID=1379 RepID=UPI0029083BBE|nr:type II-A CRISPR-associated protein Csn2 [Gemella haemolysans]MDU6572826.1 type II-A CRISPR-associated protein Csn2 [Gemella haemolysans]